MLFSAWEPYFRGLCFCQTVYDILHKSKLEHRGTFWHRFTFWLQFFELQNQIPCKFCFCRKERIWFTDVEYSLPQLFGGYGHSGPLEYYDLISDSWGNLEYRSFKDVSMILYIPYADLRVAHTPCACLVLGSYFYLFSKYNNYIRNEVGSLLWTQHQGSFERSKSILAAFGLERTERLKWEEKVLFNSLPPALIGILLKVNHLFDCPHFSFPFVNLK